MPNSSAINPGDDLLSAQYNALRDDVLDTASGHDHSGVAEHGKRVHHGATTGLGDDDHPQYPGHAQAETISGAWTFTGTMRVPSGTEFPGAPVDGSIFYRTDEDLLYIYDGAGWERIQNHAVDVVVEQVGAPAYKDVQDWINTMQSAGAIADGAITATSYAITDADEVAETFKVAGDMMAYFADGVVFTVSGSTGNDGDYTTIGNATYAAGETTITVANVPDGTDDGNITDGRVNVAAGKGMIKKTDDEFDGVTAFMDWPTTNNILLVDAKRNTIYVDYNAGTPTVRATDDPDATVDHTTKFTIGSVFREGTVVHILSGGTRIYNLARRAHGRARELRSFERASDAIISNEGTLKIKVTAGVLYAGFNRYTTSEVDTSGAGRFRAWYHDGGGNWTSTGHPADQTDIDSANYDTGTGLAALANNRYGVYWVYLDNDSHLHVVYGRASYKLHEAEAAELPAVPDICSRFSVLVARIIAFKDAPEITEAASAFETTFLVATPANYQDLANRGHDLLGADHQDTLADTVIDGDVIIGNATPKWSRLARAVPAVNVRNVLGIDDTETRPSWKTALDATNPADIAGAASPGTALPFSHRDHVHKHPAGLGVALHHVEPTAAPTASKPLLMNANAKFPTHTIAGDLGVEGELDLPTAKKMITRSGVVQGVAEQHALYQLEGAAAVDVVTIGFPASWAGCLVKLEIAVQDSGTAVLGGGIIAYSLRGHAAANPIVDFTSFMGKDLTGNCAWTMDTGTAKLSIDPGIQAFDTVTVLVTVIGAARVGQSMSTTWH